MNTVRVTKGLKGYAKSFDIPVPKDMSGVQFGHDNKNSKLPEVPMQLMSETRGVVADTISKELETDPGVKYVRTLAITFYKELEDGNRVYRVAYFNSKPGVILRGTSYDALNDSLETSEGQISNTIEMWTQEGSGWVIDSIKGSYLNLNRYQPLRGSNYLELPKELQNSRKGLVNIQNKDDECFRWCHIRMLNPQKVHPHRVKGEDHDYIKTLDYSGITFPVTVNQYPKIEKQCGINVNVFGYNKGERYPIYVSKLSNSKVLNLLLISNGKKTHYVLITNFDRFMYNQTKHREKKHFCMYCLQCFSSDRVLTNHKSICLSVNGKQAVEMPKPGSSVKFVNYHKQLPVPFVIYADFEAILENITNDSGKSYQFQNHVDCGYGYKVVCSYDDSYSKPVKIYRGPNAVSKFIDKMLEEVEYCKKIRRKVFNKELTMSADDETNFKAQKKCHICGLKYKKGEIVVRDHCHATGKYRGSAHQLCNRNFRMTDKIPVLFHNLRGYDSHFIMQQIGQVAARNNLQINVIPNNMERYMAFMLGSDLVFLDSMQYMSSGLDRLAGNLPSDKFIRVTQEFGDNAEIMKKKGVYPYDYMNSFSKFKKRRLPSIERFYSRLDEEHISPESYEHAKKVWETFGMKNMGEYHDLYLRSDVALLADVFENFRETCLENYRLDPCHYFTSPGLAWDAMLKMTGIKLGLISDIDMYQFIEKGMRGGTSYISKRYAEANNPYLPGYRKDKPNKYIMYLDANNLYGWAMSQSLPTGGFKWLDPDNVKDLEKYTNESKKGIILEVDLEYPEELHDLHNDYPLAPEHRLVKDSELSEYCIGISNKFNLKPGKVRKLMTTLYNKKKYVCHNENLKLYLDLGMRVTKVYRILEFDQSKWLGQYINFNTVKRTAAKNAFEKDFFKLMNNSVFGKTMENLRKRVDVRLVTDKKRLIKLVSSPTFVTSKIINKDLVIIHKVKESLLLNRPAYVGMCILDLSKRLMYDFHYNYTKRWYGNKANLLFTDTDSLVYEIETDDVYKDFMKYKDLFDNSDYPETSQFYFKENKKVIGKMKDETAGTPIAEFVGLRSKNYSVNKGESGCIKKCKGVKKSVVKKNIKHEDYKRVLFDSKIMTHDMKTIRSHNHDLGSYNINKASLSCFDDKRYLLSGGIESLAYGHSNIRVVDRDWFYSCYRLGYCFVD